MLKEIEMVSYEDIPEYTGLNSNSISITVKDGCCWDGHKFGTWVGRVYQNGKIDSAFKEDEKNGNTEIFSRLCNDMHLFEKSVTVLNDKDEIENATDYYIPYKVKRHCSAKPTIIESYVDNCSNVHYSVEYEILLTAGDGFTRYIVVPFETEGHYSMNFFNQVKDIEEMFEEWFEEESHDFKHGDYGKEVAFYNEIGEKLFIEISSINELLSMISSIRVIKCDHEILGVEANRKSVSCKK